jgi:hypothetical protein
MAKLNVLPLIYGKEVKVVGRVVAVSMRLNPELRDHTKPSAGSLECPEGPHIRLLTKRLQSLLHEVVSDGCILSIGGDVKP